MKAEIYNILTEAEKSQLPNLGINKYRPLRRLQWGEIKIVAKVLGLKDCEAMEEMENRAVKKNLEF